MHYYLYKLNFQTPVHFGADLAGIGVEKAVLSCHADTLFSAICHEVLHLYGETELENWVKMAQDEQFLISDLFPYNKEDLYLPKPCYVREEKDEFKSCKEFEASSIDKKRMKKLKFIPIHDWDVYNEYLFSMEKKFEPSKPDFFEEILTPKVSLPRDKGDNKLYSVGAYSFDDEAGLYFIASFNEEQKANTFNKIIESLGYSGIGGERSSGYGKFIVNVCKLEHKGDKNDPDLLLDILTRKDNKFFVSLSVISPKDEELSDDTLDNSFYMLVSRKGFVSSANYSKTPVKRKPVVMFNTGSCFSKKLKGQILDVSKDGNHPVYRYGKAMMVGI